MFKRYGSCLAATRNSQLATRNFQRATCNAQRATCSTGPKYPHRIHILHCPQSQHMSKSPQVATSCHVCLLQLQLMLMNCCLPPGCATWKPPCLACCQQISVHFSQLTKFFISFWPTRQTISYRRDLSTRRLPKRYHHSRLVRVFRA